MSDLEQLDRFVATFQPQRIADLRAGADAAIGFRTIWEACWLIEEGRYAGQWACMPEVIVPGHAFAWAADGDLVDRAEAGPRDVRRSSNVHD